MIGEKFTYLTVVEFAGRDRHSKKRWKCICKCGKETISGEAELKKGDTKSCGCYGKEQRVKSRLKHGQSHLNVTAEYQIWKGMKGRCYNSNNIHFRYYGGRGITVCDRWLNSFENFFEDMGKKPTKDHSIDRYPDVNGNYSPENCRWATDEQQSRGKRNNVWLEYNGERKIQEDWAKYFGVHQTTLLEHLKTKTFEQVYLFYSKKLKK